MIDLNVPVLDVDTFANTNFTMQLNNLWRYEMSTLSVHSMFPPHITNIECILTGV